MIVNTHDKGSDKYDNSKSGLEAETKQDAIDELDQNMGGCVFSTEADGAYVTYTQNGSKVKKKLGSGTLKVVKIGGQRVTAASPNFSIDVKSKLPYVYQKLTSENFFLNHVNAYTHESGRSVNSGGSSDTLYAGSYNASTGVWSMKLGGNGNSANQFLEISVVCVYVES